MLGVDDEWFNGDGNKSDRQVCVCVGKKRWLVADLAKKYVLGVHTTRQLTNPDGREVPDGAYC